jgi:hypothetical protein
MKKLLFILLDWLHFSRFKKYVPLFVENQYKESVWEMQTFPNYDIKLVRRVCAPDVKDLVMGFMKMSDDSATSK